MAVFRVIRYGKDGDIDAFFETLEEAIDFFESLVGSECSVFLKAYEMRDGASDIERLNRCCFSGAVTLKIWSCLDE